MMLKNLFILFLILLSITLGFGWWQNHQKNQKIQPNAIDIGFAQSMIQHHRQAIGMAEFLLDGKPTGLKTLARSISGTQAVEVGEMQGWLKLWNAPLVIFPSNMNWMLLGKNTPDTDLKYYLAQCAQNPTGMAGLASDADYAKLRFVSGRKRDALFLTLMRAHHEGALPMLRFAAAEANLPTTRLLAKNMLREQSQELFRIMLTQNAMLTAPPEP